jgi:phosphodiesterase/alkaline phosphatase D-like protein
LWTKVGVLGASVLVLVWRDAGVAGKIKRVRQEAVSDREGFVRHTVTGLGPGHYRYAFFSQDMTRRSTIGQLRTAFGQGDLRPLMIAPVACTNFERAPYGALEVLAELKPDVLCHLGDLSYNDGAVTLEDYRAKYAATLVDPGYKAILPAVGRYATWDDHEIGNDFDPEKLAAEAPAQLAAAVDAYYEVNPLPERPASERRLWGSYRWGDTAELFVLDCRSERRPSTRASGDGIYISAAQETWLLEALEASPCRYKVIMSSVPIARLFGLWNLALNDRWEGYGRQREALIQHLTTRVSGRVLFISGDFHCNYVGRVETEGPAANIFEICTSTGARAPNPVAVLYDTGDLPPEESFPPNQFVFGSGNTRAACVVSLDPLNDEVRVKFVDGRAETRGTVHFDGVIPYV